MTAKASTPVIPHSMLQQRALNPVWYPARYQNRVFLLQFMLRIVLL